MTKDRLDLLRECDHFVMEGLRRHNLYDSIWQCPTAMVPMSINGQGSELVVIRPVHTKRAMTARPASFPTKLVEELRKDILAIDNVAGLCLDLTSKPPGTIEWE
jgi:GMP synthase (glutamine-hydrolysing)